MQAKDGSFTYKKLANSLKRREEERSTANQRIVRNLDRSRGVGGLEIGLPRWPANSSMRKRDDADNGDENSESSAGASEPKNDEGEEHNASRLDVVIKGNAGDDERFGVEEVKVEVSHDDEKAAEECEWGGEDGETGHDEKDDEVVESIIFGILLNAVEELGKLGLAHLRGVEKLAPRARARPHIAHALLQRIQGRDQAGHHGQGRR